MKVIAILLLVGVFPATYYGIGDGYMGLHPAAYWHGRLEEGAPNVVDYHYLGVAYNNLPLGTKVRLTIVDLPEWAQQEYSYLIGRTVEVAVWDRLSQDYWFDLTPAAAKILMGPDFRRIGRVEVRAEVVEEMDGRHRWD